MKRFYSFLLIALIGFSVAIAQQIDLEQAKSYAASFWSETGTAFKQINPSAFTLAATSQDHPALQGIAGNLYYILEAPQNQGFVILSGDMSASPIIGYSTEAPIDNGNLPPALQDWLRDVGLTIDHQRQNQSEADPETAEAWKMLSESSFFPKADEVSAVQPLLDITWNQNPFYNDDCPVDQATGQKTVVGCVATALSQVLKFWEYPRQGVGFHSYNHPKYGLQSANFGATVYDWSAMPNEVTSANPEVARLCYHAGVAINMNYGTIADGGSAAYTIIDKAPTQYTAEFALTNFFGYSSSVQGYAKGDYTGDWIQLLKDELDAGRPMLYGGQGPGGGHTWVVDGYDANSLFHMNWGWGGLSDGFFDINLADPGNLGTGGGQGGFSGDQIVVVGIEPPVLPQPGLGETMQISALTSIQPNPVTYNNAFAVTTNLQNTGTDPFNGDIGAGIFDKRTGEFLKFIETKTNQTLAAGQSFGSPLTFNAAASQNLLPGQYEIAILLNRGEGWVLAGNQNFNNPVQLDVELTADINLFSDLELVPGPNILQNQAFSVKFSVTNTSSASIQFTPSLNLYKTDGTFIQSIGTFPFQLQPLPAGSIYPDLSINVAALNLDPGAYLLSLFYEETGQPAQLVGAATYENPIVVNVVQQDPQPDQYEHNDYFENAHIFPLDLSSGSDMIATQGANIHKGTDYDFYRVNLPAGADYNVIARIHDAFSDTLGGNFTTDVLWSYRIDNGAPVFIFDDTHPDSFMVEGGKSVTFQISPYYTGLLGTYELDVTVKEAVASSIFGMDASLLRVYPNPASDHLVIELPNDRSLGGSLELFDPTGKLVRQFPIQKRSGDRLQVSLNDLPDGLYMLRGMFEDELFVAKLVIQR